jgi:hypothetical protein
MKTQILLLNGLTTPDWLSHIYDVNTASTSTNELDCFNQCLNIQKSNCDFFVFLDSTCYLGNYDFFKINSSNSSFAALKNTAVKIIKGNLKLKNNYKFELPKTFIRVVSYTNGLQHYFQFMQ